jgi:hypothetical protein
MKKFLGLFLLSVPLAAQVVITPNVPKYPFQVLAGSTRQINVQITGGTKNTVNWSVASTTGGATATFTDISHAEVASISGALPTIQVNIGPTQGNCSINGTSTYTVTSTASVTIQAQSVDDTSKTASFLFNVCANAPPTLANGTNSVIVAPFYRQAYQGQKTELQSWVVGCVDETGVWSIKSQPTGGNGTLADTIFRDTVFSATVQGEYTVQFKANCHSGTNTAIIYVASAPLPYAATPEKTMPVPCEIDAQACTTDYEVGAGKQYADLSATPLQLASAAGVCVRVWNTDTTGSNPSVYHNYLLIHNSGGTATHPQLFCGVPDSKGNLPVLDASSSTTQTGAQPSLLACGVISLIGPNHYGYWGAGSAGPLYTSITGFHLRNARPAYTFAPPAGGTAGSGCGAGGSGTALTWAEGAAGIYDGSGAYHDFSGNHMDNNTNGFFSAENGNNAWSTTTQNLSFVGNHIEKSGTAGAYTEHQMYVQSFYSLVEANLTDNYLSTALGGNIKFRGLEGIFRYNYSTGDYPQRCYDGVENQDQAQYVAFEQYIANMWAYESTPANGPAAGANIIAAYQESAQKDILYGNVFPSGPGAYNALHYSDDHDGYSGGMNDRNGQFLVYNNTISAGENIIDVGENGIGDNTFYQPRVTLLNNILWPLNGTLTVQGQANVILNTQTNLFQTGTVSATASGTGWSTGCDPTPCAWPLTTPLNTHIYNLTSANYLFTSTLPFNAATFVPTAGSAAIGTGSVLTGLPAQLPVRWNYNVTTSALTPRIEPLTIGAEDSGSPPPPPPVAPTNLTGTIAF